MRGNGGLDVISSNRAYDEYTPRKSWYKICGVNRSTNLYAIVVNRFSSIINIESSFGMIILMSFVNTERMRNALSQFLSKYKSVYFSHYEGTSNPGILFYGVKAQLSIVIGRNNCQEKDIVQEQLPYTTHYNRFYANERFYLFDNYTYTNLHRQTYLIPNS